VLPVELAEANAAAADEVAAGAHDAQFPIDVFPTGSGTSSNMNANEVIATLASGESGRHVHPNRPGRRLAEQQRRVPDDEPPRGDRSGGTRDI
jgi:fumarate hydratase class II